MSIRLRVKRLTIDSMILAAALIFSYVETLIPSQFKLGLANIAVMYAFYRIGKIDSLLISFSRVILISILFGSVSSFMFSLSGAVFAYLTLLISKPIHESNRISFIGVSVMCSAAHNLGQILMAMLMFSGMAVLSFLPWLLMISVPTGLVTGVVINVIWRYDILKS